MYTVQLDAQDRSIPAYAGDPHPPQPTTRYKTVYPRLRGGSAEVEGHIELPTGLSPPTRGIRLADAAWWAARGSIPAYAGDPNLKAHMIAAHKVYPRLRGGSPTDKSVQAGVNGLSPPTRGILGRRGCCMSGLGSIPAYAGDPPCYTQWLCVIWVYPRLRGGSSG